MTWVWIFLAIIIVIIVYCMIDYSLGKKRYYQLNPKKEYTKRYGDIQLFTHGNDLFSSFFTDIREATSSIHILFYIVKDDQLSKEFLQLLIKKAEEGIEVRLLMDWIGSHNVSTEMLKKLKKAGGYTAFSNRPKWPFPFYSLQRRNHRKITIIDGKYGYLGGYNIGKEYMDHDPVLNPWRDYHLRITGESVADLQTEFIANWESASDKFTRPIDKYYPKLSQGSILHQFIAIEGVGLESIICKLIESAKHSIIIGTPYFIPSNDISQRLKEALKRGVKIKIIVPQKSDHVLVKEASFYYFRELIPLGAEVYQYLNGFYHAKVVMIDKDICRLGTANFDKRSLFLNQEINCYIYDQNFIQIIFKVIEKDINDSRKISYEELTSPSFLVKVKEFAAKTISDLL